MSGPIITDKQYQEMFQIGVTPEMLGVKEMSVKELSLSDGYVTVKQLNDTIIIKLDIPCAVASLDRNQAHLLMLWLQEHLK